MKHHSDFDLPWCQSLLSSDISVVEVPPRDPKSLPTPDVSNSMFLRTLYTDHGIRAQVNFSRATSEPDAITPANSTAPYEYCYLLSIGDGVDGKTGRAHGGFNALILDHMLGSMASRSSDSTAPATATMTIDYKAPIDTPGVILCRGWAVEINGRKIWVKGVVEDGTGKPLAAGKALFISPRASKA